MKLAKLVIGSGADRLKAQSLQAKLNGDTEKAVDLLAAAKMREREFRQALRALRN